MRRNGLRAFGRRGRGAPRVLRFVTRRVSRIGHGLARRRGVRPVVFAAGVLALMLLVVGIPMSVGSCVSARPRLVENDAIAFDREPEIRARIVRGSPEVVIDGAKSIHVRVSEASVIAPAPVTLKRTSAKAVEAVSGGQVVASGEVVSVSSADAREAGQEVTVRVAGVNYVGVCHARAGASGGVDVVNEVGVEAYLTGVISKELYQQWPLETYKVQAVCARTYALHERARKRKSGVFYDVESTTADQVFGGATGLRVAHDAVLITRGQVLTYDGAILRAYYSSTCGGRSASAADTWPTEGEYAFNLARPIQGTRTDHVCQESPLYTWTVEREAEDVLERVRAWGKANSHTIAGLTSIAGVRAIDHNRTGRPSHYEVKERSGVKHRISGEELRLALNTTTPTRAAPTRDKRVNSGDLEVEAGVGVVRISGRGFGHGVGMCQFCAKGWADKGVLYSEMLSRFYPRARLVRAY